MRTSVVVPAQAARDSVRLLRLRVGLTGLKGPVWTCTELPVCTCIELPVPRKASFLRIVVHASRCQMNNSTAPATHSHAFEAIVVHGRLALHGQLQPPVLKFLYNWLALILEVTLATKVATKVANVGIEARLGLVSLGELVGLVRTPNRWGLWYLHMSKADKRCCNLQTTQPARPPSLASLVEPLS